jgi:predicted lipoprotein with Yx(FWY)xxD motif
MHIKAIVTAAMLASASSAALAQADMPTGVKMTNGMMTDSKGMVLYTFDKDVPGKSNCNGQCLVNWPALMADAGATAKGDWTIVTRDEGAKQWAYKGKPLYYFVQDKNPGDMIGENRGNVWHIVK